MAEKPAKGLQCIDCSDVYAISPANYSECCFSPLLPSYSPQNGGGLKDRIRNGPRNMFRYEPFLPTSAAPPYNLGLTELVLADELGRFLHMQNGKLYIKVDEGSVTGTFKDRGAAIVAQLVVEFNKNGYDFKLLGGTSTGNLASAIPAAAQLINLKSVVLVHEGADEGLVQKALSFGAYVIVVKGDYSKVDGIMKHLSSTDDRLSSQIAWVNINLRPLYSQGSKTVGFEIAEQLGWKSPRNIVHPVAAGLSLWQIYQGLKEFQQFGLINELTTRMHAAQTSACDPVVQAWNRGEPFKIIPVESKKSIAETLCVGDPSNGYQVLEVLKESRGSAIAVSEEDIAKGIDLVSQTTDFKTGPVGGVVVASARKLVSQGLIKPDEQTILVLTDGYKGDKVYRGPFSEEESRHRLILIEPDRRVIQATLEDILNGRR